MLGTTFPVCPNSRVVSYCSIALNLSFCILGPHWPVNIWTPMTFHPACTPSTQAPFSWIDVSHAKAFLPVYLSLSALRNVYVPVKESGWCINLSLAWNHLWGICNFGTKWLQSYCRRQCISLASFCMFRCKLNFTMCYILRCLWLLRRASSACQISRNKKVYFL